MVCDVLTVKYVQTKEVLESVLYQLKKYKLDKVTILVYPWPPLSERYCCCQHCLSTCLLWYLTGDSAALLLRHLSNVRLIRQHIYSSFQTDMKDRYLEHLLWNATRSHGRLISIGSGNGLMPWGIKPLPEPVLTQICVYIWHHKAIMS